MAQWRYAEDASAPHDKTLNPGQKAFEDMPIRPLWRLRARSATVCGRRRRRSHGRAAVLPLYYYVFKALINQDVVTGIQVAKSGNWIFRKC